MSTEYHAEQAAQAIRSLDYHMAALGQDTSCLDQLHRTVQELLAKARARAARRWRDAPDDVPAPTRTPVADLPVPRGWAGADLDGVRAVFQSRIAQDVARMAQDGSARSEALPVADEAAEHRHALAELARTTQDPATLAMVLREMRDHGYLPVACGPDEDDEDARPAKTREQLEQERERLLEELEREAQEEQAAWREAKQDAHYP